MIEVALGFNDGKILGTDKDIELRYYGGELIGTTLAYVYGIILGLDVGTDLGYLDASFEGSNDGMLEILLLVDAVGSNVLSP